MDEYDWCAFGLTFALITVFEAKKCDRLDFGLVARKPVFSVCDHQAVLLRCRVSIV